MGKIERGIKAGILAMIIANLISTVVSLLLIALLIPYPSNPSFLFFMFTGVIVGTLIYGVITGAVLGTIYAAIYAFLPSKSPIIKGIFLGIVYYLISIMFEYLFVLSYSPRSMETGGYTTMILSPAGLISLISEIFIFGYFIGKFWGAESIESEMIKQTSMHLGMA